MGAATGVLACWSVLACLCLLARLTGYPWDLPVLLSATPLLGMTAFIPSLNPVSFWVGISLAHLICALFGAFTESARLRTTAAFALFWASLELFARFSVNGVGILYAAPIALRALVSFVIAYWVTHPIRPAQKNSAHPSKGPDGSSAQVKILYSAPSDFEKEYQELHEIKAANRGRSA